MIENAGSVGLDLTVISRMVELMDSVWFTAIIEMKTQWPLQGSGPSKRFAETVRGNLPVTRTNEPLGIEGGNLSTVTAEELKRLQGNCLQWVFLV
jgi:hypothetical protein